MTQTWGGRRGGGEGEGDGREEASDGGDEY